MGVGGCEHGGAGGGVVEGLWRGVREITWLASSWRIYFWNLETGNCWMLFSAGICVTFRAHQSNSMFLYYILRKFSNLKLIMIRFNISTEKKVFEFRTTTLLFKINVDKVFQN